MRRWSIYDETLQAQRRQLQRDGRSQRQARTLLARESLCRGKLAQTVSSHSLVGTIRGGIHPSFDPQQRHRVPRDWLPHLHNEPCGRANLLGPSVPPQNLNRQDRRLEQAVGLHIHRVADAPSVGEGDGAGAEGRGVE
jgi:hypothetical protein